MRTTLYLLRHGATAANLARPYRLQGRGQDQPLDPVGVRQAELTRNLLAVHPIDICYTSPLKRAFDTAAIISEPHGIQPIPLDDLIECDAGEWEGLDWVEIEKQYPEAYRQFHADPSRFGYPGGETFQQVYNRVSRALEQLWKKHEGESILVVAHHVVNRTYLAGVLGLPMQLAHHVRLENCGISLVTREDGQTVVRMLNASFHLQGLVAA
ncbi:MAG: alpha-ribazole phosphatase [Gemmatales bacterium]|nr:MAG: alpha-ribazole phosphatase [Gemmatales bacterium]